MCCSQSAVVLWPHLCGAPLSEEAELISYPGTSIYLIHYQLLPQEYLLACTCALTCKSKLTIALAFRHSNQRLVLGRLAEPDGLALCSVKHAIMSRGSCHVKGRSQLGTVRMCACTNVLLMILQARHRAGQGMGKQGERALAAACRQDAHTVFGLLQCQ